MVKKALLLSLFNLLFLASIHDSLMMGPYYTRGNCQDSLQIKSSSDDIIIRKESQLNGIVINCLELEENEEDDIKKSYRSKSYFSLHLMYPGFSEDMGFLGFTEFSSRRNKYSALSLHLLFRSIRI